MKTIAEQITLFQAKRGEQIERMNVIMARATEEGRTLDATEAQSYDGIKAEVDAIDAHLARLRDQEKVLLSTAKPVLTPVDPGPGRDVAGQPYMVIPPKLEPGVKFARYAMALFQAQGNNETALQIVRANKRWMDTSPQLEKVMMAAVAAGDTTTAGWASELVYAENLANEFIEYLRPRTIVGKLSNIRRVPFNVRVGGATAGTSGNWVGQGAPIPMSKMTTTSISLGITKAAGLVAIDDELLRSSSPSAEMMVRDDLASTLSTLLDTSFIDPNQGGSANVQPAAVTYGCLQVQASGTNAAAVAADVKSAFATAIAANLDVSKGVWVMSPTIALALSLMLTSLGTPQYPGISVGGGTFMGLPVIVSQAAYISGSPDFGNMIVFLVPEEIMLADDGQATIQISNEATLQMLDNPTNASTGGTAATTQVSMYQTHSWAIKAVRYMNWKYKRSAAVSLIRSAAYA